MNNIAVKLPFEVWEYNLTTGRSKKHSAFEKRIDAEKMKRSMEMRRSGNIYTITTSFIN